MSKKIVIFSLFFLSFLTISFYSIGQDHRINDTLIDNYKVIKISKVKNGFAIILHNERLDFWYDVATSREKAKKMSKIIAGKTYELTLIPISEINIVPCLGLTWIVEINNKKILIKSNSWTGNVYTSPNLRGVYYIGNTEDMM